MKLTTSIIFTILLLSGCASPAQKQQMAEDCYTTMNAVTAGICRAKGTEPVAYDAYKSAYDSAKERGATVRQAQDEANEAARRASQEAVQRSREVAAAAASARANPAAGAAREKALEPVRRAFPPKFYALDNAVQKCLRRQDPDDWSCKSSIAVANDILAAQQVVAPDLRPSEDADYVLKDRPDGDAFAWYGWAQAWQQARALSEGRAALRAADPTGAAAKECSERSPDCIARNWTLAREAQATALAKLTSK
jgi:hypothetical protein